MGHGTANPTPADARDCQDFGQCTFESTAANRHARLPRRGSSRAAETMHDSPLGRVLLVGLGGFLGSSTRFLLSGWVQRAVPLSTFPHGTWVVNVLGCLTIGFLGGYSEARQVLGPAQRLFLFIGFLGGFTTFSTFAFETLGLTRDSEFLKATGNVLVHVVAGFLAVWIGYGVARTL